MKWKSLGCVWLFCNPLDYTVCGILQARLLEWVAFPFSRGSSQPRDWIQVSHIAGGFFTSWTTREAQKDWYWWIRESLKWGNYSLGCIDIWIIADGLWRLDFFRDPRKGQLNFMTLKGTRMVESYSGERWVLCAEKLGCESSLCR